MKTRADHDRWQKHWQRPLRAKGALRIAEAKACGALLYWPRFGGHWFTPAEAATLHEKGELLGDDLEIRSLAEVATEAGLELLLEAKSRLALLRKGQGR